MRSPSATPHVKLIDRALQGYLSFTIRDSRKTLKEAILYSVTAKAKRVRPLLTIASYQLFDSKIEKIMPVACAVEMVHTYSLIHDDLPAMDNDDYRRGQLTCHKKYGEAMAILAGDTLNTFVFELVARELPRHFSASDILKAIELMAYAFGIHGMAGGQAMDLQGSSRTLAYLKSTHLKKTAAMIEACVSIPAILCKADVNSRRHLSQFGMHLGLLFQIVDDILDVTGNKQKLGKTANKDRDQNKLTYVSLCGLEKAKAMARAEARSARRHLAAVNLDTRALQEFVTMIVERDH